MANALAKIRHDGPRMLAECKTVADAKQNVALGEAAVAYLKSLRVTNTEELNVAVEFVVRNERLAGEMLAATEFHKGGRPAETSDTVSPVLSDLNVTKKQSSRWQAIAAIPEDEFNAAIEAKVKAGQPLRKTEFVRMGQRIKAAFVGSGDGVADAAGCEVVTDLSDLGGRRFGTIYADPPWQYGNQATRASTDCHYSTMTVDDLCAMPVADLAADDSHLHLWTTNGFLREAFDVMDAWGFEYRSALVWVKPQMGIGNYWRVSHEYLLLGIRGDAKRFFRRDLKSWVESPRGRHSAKPDAVRAMVEQASPGPWLELFGRSMHHGWVVYGNQVEPSLLCPGVG